MSAESCFPESNITGNEDCLFLNIFAPADKINLPVMVYIHGGGYGQGQANVDLTSIINMNNNSFIGVSIQYRLGAFGFLSSDEVMRFGAVNAGLLDQTFALQWIIAASPYLPQQYGYADFVPSQSYYAFASAAGCFGPPALGRNNVSNSIFQCLVNKDTETLQNASATISSSSRYGTWGFLPVTDGVFIQQLPSQQLLQKQVNGVNMLVGNNADEGPFFTPPNIITEDDFIEFIRNTFPLFTDSDVEKLLYYYPSTDGPTEMSDPEFATMGNGTSTALNQSTFGTGQQQRASNVYAETTFVCPSYWMAEAFASPLRTSYKYQYSVVGAIHGIDYASYFGPPFPNQGPDFNRAFMTIWGNFITGDNPSISAEIANGADSTSTTSPATEFPVFSIAQPYQLNLNQTGGIAYSTQLLPGAPNITQYQEPGLMNAFDIVNAYAWEGGRGTRCDFWRSVASVVPE
ncbi:MAG: hypothetical protein Q9164_004034 [Protoblastenia rupestris]